MIRIPENKLRVVAPEVGGGFGSKLNLYPEEAVVSYLAMRLDRPVKWIEGRRENAAATIHGRDQIADCEIAIKKDGTVLAIRSKTIVDIGSYRQLLTPAIPTLTGLMLCGCYKLKAVRMDVTGVHTKQDVDRRVSRCRSTRSDIRDRAGDRISWPPNSASIRLRCDSRTCPSLRSFRSRL